MVCGVSSTLKARLDSKRNCVRLELGGAEELAFYGAAYLSTEQAYVGLQARGKGNAVILWPKKGKQLKSLAEAFELEYENQRHRWAVARQNLDVRGEIARRAVALAESMGTGVKEIGAGLAPEQKAEIERLLAEAEAAPKDPLGIAAPWEELRKAGAA